MPRFRTIVGMFAVGCLFGGSAAGQVLHFGAPILNLDVSASPQPAALRGMRVTVTWVNPSTSASSLQIVETNSSGQIPFPAGLTPQTAIVLGPRSPRIMVKRPLNLPTINLIPGPWTVTADYTTQPLAVDVTTLPSSLAPVLPQLPPHLTIAECSAFQHVYDADIALAQKTGTTFTTLLDVGFVASPGSSVPQFIHGSAGVGAQNDRIEIYTGGSSNPLDPNSAPAGCSPSILAHELAHRTIHFRYGAGINIGGLIDEALADFLSSVATGSPVIGSGVLATPRDLRIVTMQGQSGGSVAHQALPLSSALYRTREAYAAHDGTAAAFDAMIPGLLSLPVPPATFEEVLCGLLNLDLAQQGGAYRNLILNVFVQHGIIAPLSCFPPVLTTPGGWGAGSSPPPQAAGTASISNSTIAITATTSAPRQGLAVVSSLPQFPTLVAPQLYVAVDLSTLVIGPAVATNATGHFTLTSYLPPGLPPFVLEFVFANPAGPFGVEVSNGLLIHS